MSLLSPTAMYHAELREQLGTVGRALSVQRAMLWAARGVAVGVVGDLGLIVWAWTRDQISHMPIAVVVGLPLGIALLFALGSLLVRQDTRELARRVDRAARLQERSTTALELGGRNAEFPLAVAQMRDAVEHLKRVDLLEAFPLRLPRNELMAAFFVAVIAGLIAISPNPWLLRARASNPAITVAREQAQRVDRLAESIKADQATQLNPLQEMLRKGAKTIDTRSNQPDEALSALDDLEAQVRAMSTGDDQLSAALAAIASALASDPTTQQLASAINTGDLREVSRAAQALAQQTDQLSGQDKQRVAKVLRDSAGRAGRASASVAGNLTDAANALDQSGSGGDPSQAASAMQNGAQQGTGSSASASASNGRSATDALKQLSSDAAAAAERQRAQSQLESSRNALERALGRTQSRSGSSSSGNRSSSSSQRNQSGSQPGDPNGQSGGQGQGNDPSQTGDQGSNGGNGGQDGSTGDGTSEGSGYSTGGQNQNKTGPSSSLDTITRPEQVPQGSQFTPDQSSQNPYLGDASNGAAQAGTEPVSPSYSSKPTQGNGSAAIPLGLRDLVKDYFSSLDQK